MNLHEFTSMRDRADFLRIRLQADMLFVRGLQGNREGNGESNRDGDHERPNRHIDQAVRHIKPR
jgi:hypothetical protein